MSDNIIEDHNRSRLNSIRMERLDFYQKAMILAVAAFFVANMHFLLILFNGILNITSLAMLIMVLVLSANWWQYGKKWRLGKMDYANLLDKEDLLIYKKNLEKNFPIIVHQYAATIFLFIYILLIVTFLQPVPLREATTQMVETMEQIGITVIKLEAKVGQIEDHTKLLEQTTTQMVGTIKQLEIKVGQIEGYARALNKIEDQSDPDEFDKMPVEPTQQKEPKSQVNKSN